MKRSFTYSTLKGTKHKENWDNYLVIDQPEYSLFAVFDGVSSAKHGKEATLEAKSFIFDKYLDYLDDKMDLQRLMYDFNCHLLSLELNEPYSTYCILFFDKTVQSYHYSWLGDSRLYAITNQFVKQLTDDDSFSEHVITKFLGHPHLEFEDFRQCESKKTFEHLLLCTDGFYRVFESNIMDFFDNFHKKELGVIKDEINSLIKGRNRDDSTYIFVK